MSAPHKARIAQRRRKQMKAKQDRAETLSVREIHESLRVLRETRDDLLMALHDERPSYYTPQVGGMALREDAEIPYQEMWARVKWTATAAQMIRDEEFRYISPEFDLDFTDEGTGNKIGGALLAIGLTNRPFLKGMAPVGKPDANDESDVQVFVTGEWHHPFYGRFTVEPRHLQEMVGNMSVVMGSVREESEHGPTGLVVDYNHGSLWMDPDAAKAAGWVTDKGVWVVDEAGMVVTATAPQTKAAAVSGAETARSKTMKDARIREILSLKDDVEVTPEIKDQALEALDKLAHEQAQGPEEKPEGAPAEPVTATERNDGKFVLSAEGYTALKTAADAGVRAEQVLKQRDAEAAVTKAISDGKLAPKLREWAKGYALADPAGFGAYIENAPQVVSMKPEGGDGKEDDPSGDGDKVRAFVAAEQKGGLSLADAQVKALKQFGAAAFAEYRKLT